MTDVTSLVIFRILFGLMMLVSLIRFMTKGWVQTLYIDPQFFFSYYGFEWVKPMGVWTYGLFVLCIFSIIGVLLGYKYRLSIVLFWLSFTYIELMDKTTYLNHYYFVSLVAFIMIWLPAHRSFSLDCYLNREWQVDRVPRWTVDVIRLMLGIVYFYAGLAKLNSDWLFHAQPMKIWMSSKYDFPILGQFVHEAWLAPVMSWGGAIYDLLIPFLLMVKRIRPVAYIAVIVFHLITGWLFPIGMFPYLMMICSLIFFDAALHGKMLFFMSRLLRVRSVRDVQCPVVLKKRLLGQYVLPVFFLVQLLLPLRHRLYPGELFWTEEGFRFSWRVMLMEKAGYTTFTVVDGVSGKKINVQNDGFLTSFQEKQMSFQPDFILEFAHFLKKHFEQEDGMKDVAVYVNSYVTLNGRLSQRFIDPNVDLTNQELSVFGHQGWVLPFNPDYSLGY